jgi:hypothetical protein
VVFHWPRSLYSHHSRLAQEGEDYEVRYQDLWLRLIEEEPKPVKRSIYILIFRVELLLIDLSYNEHQVCQLVSPNFLVKDVISIY